MALRRIQQSLWVDFVDLHLALVGERRQVCKYRVIKFFKYELVCREVTCNQTCLRLSVVQSSVFTLVELALPEASQAVWQYSFVNGFKIKTKFYH